MSNYNILNGTDCSRAYHDAQNRREKSGKTLSHQIESCHFKMSVRFEL